MEQLYFKYRPLKHDTMPFPTYTMNGGYPVSFFFNQTRSWYIDNGLEMKDQFIVDEMYNDSSKGKRLMIVNVPDTMNGSEIAFDIVHDYTQNAVNSMTKADFAQAIRDWTDVPEIQSNVFEIAPETTNIEGKVIPPVLLDLN